MNLLFLTESYLGGVFLDYYRQAIVDTLVDMGFSVHVVKINVPGMTAELIHQVCQQVQPDVVLSINAAGIALLPPALKAERLLWFIDSYERMPPNWVPFFTGQGHVFLTGIHRYVERFKALYPNIRVHTVPFGASVSRMDWPALPERPNDVFFVGTAFGGPHGTGTLATALARVPEESRPTVIDAIQHHADQYDFTIGQVLKTYEAPEQKPTYDAFFYRCLVDDALSVQKRMLYLSALANTRLALYGDSREGWIAHILMHNPTLLSRFQYQAITDPVALSQHYANSRMALNIQHHQAFDFGLSWRVFEIMACGSLLLTEGASRVPLNHLGFEENVHYVAFDSVAQLQELVAYYQQHPQQAENIMVAAHSKVMEGHLLVHRLNTLLALANVVCPGHNAMARCHVVPSPPCPDKVKRLSTTPAWHFKTRLGRKYYLKMELLRQ